MAKSYLLIINQATEYQSHHAAIKFVMLQQTPIKALNKHDPNENSAH